MINSVGSIVLAALAIGAGLYVLWLGVDHLDHYLIRRHRARISKEAGGESICKWGVNSEGELVHIRCKRPSQN